MRARTCPLKRRVCLSLVWRHVGSPLMMWWVRLLRVRRARKPVGLSDRPVWCLRQGYCVFWGASGEQHVRTGIDVVFVRLLAPVSRVERGRVLLYPICHDRCFFLECLVQDPASLLPNRGWERFQAWCACALFRYGYFIGRMG